MSSSGASRYLHTATNVAGFTLVNGTPNIAQLTVPNDGLVHVLIVALTVIVTVQEVGGALGVSFTSKGQPVNFAIDSGGHAAGFNQGNMPVTLVDPNTAVTLQQVGALTGGAAAVAAAMDIF